MTSEQRMVQIKHLWEDGLGTSEIGRYIQLSVGNVSTYLNKIYGKNRERRHIYKRRVFTLNESFFEDINTEAKAYFLGLLTADGNLANSQTSVRIGLHEKDKYILEKFIEVLNYTKPLKFIKKVKEPGWNRSNQYLLEISSSIFRKSLEKQGLTPNKSFTIEFPINFPKEYIHHYIRGYFDGNGCIHIDKNNHPGISIASNEVFCKGLSDTLTSFNIRSSVCKHYKANCFYTRSSGSDNILNFYNLMYKDATIYLTRKKEIFENWILEKNSRKPRQYKRVLQYDLTGNFIREWLCSTEVSKELHTKHLQSTIGRCCKGYLNQTGGFIWKYKTIIN